MLNPVAIATLGIGFSPNYIAVEGLLASSTPPTLDTKSMAQRAEYFYPTGGVFPTLPTLAEENDELLEMYQMYLAGRRP
ncbi:MAG: hypothetical protein E6Q97_03465 [Desulfurellales bacterium]|nr:MAG: hypothetical protein E6Q97_03465 [Desulfurellales bacterium]